MPLNILLVEDNQDMRRGIGQFLNREGYNCKAVASCEDAIDEVDENKYDAAIVDINLPGKSGFDLIEYIREQSYKYPLIAMTARDGIEDKIKGFDLGLTDYIVKPFDMKELLARLNAHLTLKGSQNNEDVIDTGDFSLDPKGYTFKKNKKLIELTKIEFNILHALMKNNHQLVQIDDLINFAWGESEDMVNPPIRIHIANIRKKIGDKDYKIIRTIPGTGYIFSNPLEET